MSAVFLLLAVLLFHRGVLFGPEITFRWDFRGYHYPLAVAYADSLQEGQLPLWEPYSYCGRPLAANPQSATLYPPMAAAVAFGRSGLLERLEWLLVGHIYLAGLFTLLLGRRLGLGDAGALFAAITFALGGFFVSQSQHLGIICAAPWMVLSLYAVLRESATLVWLLALSWTLSILAGFTAFSLMTVFASALFAWCMERRIGVFRDLLAAGVLASAMAFVQLGPAMDLVSQSVARYRTDWMGSGGGIVPEALITLLVPNYFNGFDLAHFRGRGDPTQMYLFSGWTLLILVICGIHRATFRLCVFLFCSVLLMLGEFTPIGKGLFWLMPEFVQRTTYWFVFLAPVLLALSLIAGQGIRKLGRWAPLALAVAVIELTVAGSNGPLNSESTRGNPVPTENSMDGSAEFVSALRSLAGDGRIDVAGDSRSILSSAPILRLRAAGGYDPLALSGLMSVRRRAARGERWGASYAVEEPDSPALDWMSVRVVNARTWLKTKRLAHAKDIHGRKIYVNAAALPRYRAHGCNIHTLNETRNRVEIDLDCTDSTTLETSEAHFNSWVVEVDGTAAPIKVIEGAFRGVDLAAGRHHVVFRYSTSLFIWCGLITLIGWGVWIWVWRRARREADQLADA